MRGPEPRLAPARAGIYTQGMIHYDEMGTPLTIQTTGLTRGLETARATRGAAGLRMVISPGFASVEEATRWIDAHFVAGPDADLFAELCTARLASG